MSCPFDGLFRLANIPTCLIEPTLRLGLTEVLVDMPRAQIGPDQSAPAAVEVEQVIVNLVFARFDIELAQAIADVRSAEFVAFERQKADLLGGI